jgi:hypothetical protein
MKKFLIAIVVFFVLPFNLNAFQLSDTTDKGKIAIYSQYRDISPGEVIKISLQSPECSSAKVYFEGKEYSFVPDRKHTALFLLIGLGLEMKPGVHDLDIHIDFPDGSQKTYSFKLPVTKGEFPLKKITVDKKFIVPSCEAQKRIMEEVELVNEIYGAYTPGWLGSGNFIVPSNGKVRKNFGEKRIFNNEFHSRHRGVDIRSCRGSKIKAANSGKVVLTRNLYFAGNTVIIDHGAGLFTIYCHLSKTFVKEGNLVRKGNVIGLVGSTGRVTGPHLHWGVKLAGKFVNPLSLLQLSFD